ncbi:MAG: hypothetical protein ACLSIF_11690 [Faecalimonas umbilicata]
MPEAKEETFGSREFIYKEIYRKKWWDVLILCLRRRRWSEDAKDVFFQAIMSVYMDSRKKTAREKYTPKKYRKHKDKE